MKILNRKTIYDGFFKVEKITAEHKGETLERDQVTSKNAVAALVFNTVSREYLLVEQFRLSVGKPLLEVVAGLLDNPQESPETAIKREITEEIGYTVDRLQEIAAFYTTPGSYTEKITLFYAEVSRKTGAGGGLSSEHEDLKTVAFPEEKLLDYAFEDAKTLLAVWWVKAGKGK